MHIRNIAKRMRKGVPVALMAMVLSVALAACGSGGGDDKMEIGLIEGNWSSQRVMTEIANQVIGDQLEYPTNKLLTDVTPGWAAMCNEDAHLAVEAWLPSRLPEIQPFIDQGCLELGGVNAVGTIGWFVPRYLIEGDPERGIEPQAPDLRSIDQLNDYWELFENPENPGKGELMGGEIGWIDQPQDISRIMGYDLNYYRSNQAEAVLITRVKSQFRQGEPFLTYLWTPHSVFGEVDLVQLEEPNPYVDGECFVEEGVPYECAHPVFDIHTAYNPLIKEEAPDVHNFIHNMHLGDQTISELMYAVDVEERPIEEVATEWVENNQDKIDAWIEGNEA